MAIADEETIKKWEISGEKTEHYKNHQYRTKVKHVFGVVKSFSNVEKRDNEGMKNRQKMNMMFALVTLYMADKKTKFA